ncbi:unnamed protein product [Bursaphelenchus okinawaensis]|uniref:Forkhead box protein fkh-2 n=1 Tax=Bursaphelenchus okinawaensis TaxID=465554 RepID=A0A811JUN9_9BILA|nr:unnamed protein product [Bursaphelenchus okinawaensis]CAG9083252.1 unnamed protein product [Bursaphelenchus okinawaensis]
MTDPQATSLFPQDKLSLLLIRSLLQLPPDATVKLEHKKDSKPPYSYIGLIAMAILSSPERKMLLSEIYTWIAMEYSYFRNRGSGWRNSVRHNLSLNDCFVKVDRAANGKGHYWTIHPANLADFLKGDYRRRQAQWKIKSHQHAQMPCWNPLAMQYLLNQQIQQNSMMEMWHKQIANNQPVDLNSHNHVDSNSDRINV